MNTTDQLRAVACIRFVRLAAPLAGRYCQLKAGEDVRIIAMYEEAGETYWRIERKQWINHLTISNVLAPVPDHALIVDEPNAQDVPTASAAATQSQ
jgi:hypothetical protein